MRRSRPAPRPSLESLPDVRDGLTRLERVVLATLEACQAELGGRAVPTAMLYGRVLEHLEVSQDELQQVLVRLGARQRSDAGPR
ncbi:MAG: hypothetical protein JNM69_35410 [Archangium sp.]|nr:hypothetical protein [Archangium sp.]